MISSSCFVHGIRDKIRNIGEEVVFLLRLENGGCNYGFRLFIIIIVEVSKINFSRNPYKVA